MPTPVLSSTLPADTAVNVDLNVRIVLTWSTSMKAVTMSPALIMIENTDLDALVDATIEYAAGDTTALVIPDRLLEANTTYRLTFVGTDTSTSLGEIQASDDSPFPNTAYVSFTTGTEISTEGLDKTPEQEEVEGDLDLPDGVTVAQQDFYVVSTNPENRAWHVDRNLDVITVEFSDSVDASRVNSNSVVVEIFPYLEDPQHFAVPAYQGAGADPLTLPRFEWMGPYDETGGILNFDAPTGVLSVSDTEILWTKDPSRDYPYNATVEVTLDRSLADTGANELGVDQRFTFYIDPWPDWVSARRIRRALHPVDLTDFPDDVLGLAVWNATVEVGDLVHWLLDDQTLPPKQIRELIECRTVADVFRMMLAEKQLAAGQFKRLGDLEHEIRYPTTKVTDVKPEKLRKAEECDEELTARIRGYWLATPRVFVKGRLGLHERPNYRTRLWRTFQKLYTYDATPVVEGVPAGNTANERYPTLPGVLDGWA